MALLRLQPGIIYGPIKSRRLGRSLGINLLPVRYKLCSFDCVYCQYGPTKVKTLTPAAGQLPTVEQVLAAVREALQAHPTVDYLTFSGNGEPTLHPRFPAVVSGVRRLRDEIAPDVKLAILSNSTTAHLPPVRKALALLDAPILKLDAGEPRMLARVNRPAPGVSLERIVGGLKEVPNLIIQSVLVDGRVSNVADEPLEAWLSVLSEIGPAGVQVYSVDRPVPEAGIERVLPPVLQRIASEAEERTGVPVHAYWVRG